MFLACHCVARSEQSQKKKKICGDEAMHNGFIVASGEVSLPSSSSALKVPGLVQRTLHVFFSTRFEVGEYIFT